MTTAMKPKRRRGGRRTGGLAAGEILHLFYHKSPRVATLPHTNPRGGLRRC